jgi:ribosome-binding protein aMBF1 (putative translation factor)
MIQDWEVVVLNKNVTNNNNKNVNNVKKMDEVINKKPSINFQQAMQQARMTNKMSQKDLALKMGVNVNTIINYEKGKEIPTNLFISKLETLFKVPLPRIKAIKTKMVE